MYCGFMKRFLSKLDLINIGVMWNKTSFCVQNAIWVFNAFHSTNYCKSFLVSRLLISYEFPVVYRIVTQALD